MSKFTVAIPLNFEWRGLTISGAAGATHRIPDALYDEFVADFVTGKASTQMPGLTWISVDEQTAVGGEHPSLAAHDTLGLATQSELDTHAGAADPHTVYALDTDLTNHESAADPHTGYQRESEKAAASGYASLDAGTLVPAAQIGTGTADTTKFLRGDRSWQVPPSSGGAPTDATYLVTAAHASLSAEVVVGATPGGELGGTWDAPTVDATHSGSAHHTRQHSITDTADHTFPGGSTFLRADGVFASPPGGSEAFPVGSIFISVVSTAPSALLGYGTWAAFAAGRVLVGIDAGQTEFDTVEETGGAKTHTLTTAEMPAHVHDEYNNSATTGGLVGWGAQDTSTNTASLTGYDTGSTGGGGAHNNLQPYITVYMWKRTA